MALYQFRKNEDLETLLMESIPDDYMLPGKTNDEVVYFHNGDRMAINLQTGVMDFDTVHPGEMFHSRLQHCLNKWYARQIIHEIEPVPVAV